MLLSCLSASLSVQQDALTSCDDDVAVPGTLLLQTQASHATSAKPWDRRNYLVATSHKAGSHLLRNVMRRTFDILGANFSCHYIVKSVAAPITSIGGDHICKVTKAPVRFQNGNNAGTILQMRLEGPMRGVMIIRDPLEMVASAYVYHHRGAEKGSPEAPSNVMSLGPNEGVPATAETMWQVVENMAQAYQVAGDDVLPVRYEDFTRSSVDFNATMEKIIHFLFEGEITEVQKLRILQSTQYEDLNGPYGLSKSLDVVATWTPEARMNHTSDDDDVRRARAAVPLMPREMQQKYGKLREIMGYA